MRPARRYVQRKDLSRTRQSRFAAAFVIMIAIGILGVGRANDVFATRAGPASPVPAPRPCLHRSTRAHPRKGCARKTKPVPKRKVVEHWQPLRLVPGWPDATALTYTPNRIASTPARFAAIMSTLRPGDVVEVKPMTITGEVTMGQRLSAPASIYFDKGVRFTGPPDGSNRPAIWLDASNLRLYGGEVSNVAQDCVRVQAGSADASGPTNIRWWGVRIHDCAGTGFSVQGTFYPNTGLDIQADIWACGQNLNLDPHPEKGTGLHGVYLGGGSTVSSGTFVFYVHDQATGAAVSIGPNLQSSRIWVEARRISFHATYQVAGNAVQFWGNNNSNVTVEDIQANELAGRVVETDGLTGGSGIVIDRALGAAIGLSPAYRLGSFVTCVACR